MSNSFSPLMNGGNNFSRRWGGTSNAPDPYISGYFFIHFSYLPPDLSTVIANTGGPDGLSGDSYIRNVLHGSCLSVTVPGAMVNKTEIMGLGGVKWAVPTNVEWDNTISMKFLEFSTLPIHAIMHGWVKMIRDYRSGTSYLNGEGTYTKSKYAANLYFWTTKPDGRTVEYAALGTGLFPMKDPTDLLSADITTYDKLEIDIDFNCDYLWQESWVYDTCRTLANTYYNSAVGAGGRGGVIDGYGRSDGSSM